MRPCQTFASMNTFSVVIKITLAFKDFVTNITLKRFQLDFTMGIGDVYLKICLYCKCSLTYFALKASPFFDLVIMLIEMGLKACLGW